MIVVTGGEGFIGRNLVRTLNEGGYLGVVTLDTKIEPLDSILAWIITNGKNIDVIFHLGAITDTTEMDRNKFDEYNVGTSIFIWNICCEHNIPLIYASSAATYGNGDDNDFEDNKSLENLKPLNPYGWSKHQFDLWAVNQELQPPFWYGLKFFNVYGYGEADKGKMASTIYHFYKQMNKFAFVQLFKSHRLDYKDGEQLRDFIYVDDVVDVCIFLNENKPKSGIYNVGTGKARTFNDVAKAVFKSKGYPENIRYIDMPKTLRDKYQYYTEAKIDKLRGIGYTKQFHELEEGISKYINKLENENC